MLTKKDINLLKETFATKDELKEELKKYATKADIVTFKDEILHEIVKLRDEVAIVGGQRNMLEDHDQRIETIEKHLHIQPGL